MRSSSRCVCTSAMDAKPQSTREMFCRAYSMSKAERKYLSFRVAPYRWYVLSRSSGRRGESLEKLSVSLARTSYISGRARNLRQISSRLWYVASAADKFPAWSCRAGQNAWRADTRWVLGRPETMHTSTWCFFQRACLSTAENARWNMSTRSPSSRTTPALNKYSKKLSMPAPMEDCWLCQLPSSTLMEDPTRSSLDRRCQISRTARCAASW
mmetsp:Transcript_24617/g.72219  ORF Transcript_24617/g.72219 Transcript_24617/m.72219 type:complete len:212 (-) Transcript_24617:349-984(-)